MEWTKEDYTITTDKDRINVPYVHHFLSHVYWSEGIPFDVVERSIKGSLCFAVFDGEKQVGFARVITDEATFGYLADVFIDERYRGRGLGKWLVECILSYPTLQSLRRFMLATRDAHDLYKQFGFGPATNVDRLMQIHKPDLYKHQNAS